MIVIVIVIVRKKVVEQQSEGKSKALSTKLKEHAAVRAHNVARVTHAVSPSTYTSCPRLFLSLSLSLSKSTTRSRFHSTRGIILNDEDTRTREAR